MKITAVIAIEPAIDAVVDSAVVNIRRVFEAGDVLQAKIVATNWAKEKKAMGIRLYAVNPVSNRDMLLMKRAKKSGVWDSWKHGSSMMCFVKVEGTTYKFNANKEEIKTCIQNRH